MSEKISRPMVVRCRGCGAYLDLDHTQHGSHMMAYEETTGDLVWKALNRLLRECQWSRERNGYYVESRSGEDIGVAHMLREAEEAHTRYVHEHGQ